jgi:hypothetical protein
MPIGSEIRSHHTMWFTVGSHAAVAVRYAVEGEEVICFGDVGLRELGAGTVAIGTVHEIANGPPIVVTSFDVRVLVPGEVTPGTIGEVQGHLRPTVPWSEVSSTRRMLALRPQGASRAA